MLYLDFLRHGETSLSHTLRGKTDDALTAKGWMQMQSTIAQAEQVTQRIDIGKQLRSDEGADVAQLLLGGLGVLQDELVNQIKTVVPLGIQLFELQGLKHQHFLAFHFAPNESF